MKQDTGRPWRRAALWLALLGLFFFATYDFALVYASRLAQVPSLAFGWERHAPFLAWTIVPYWSSDVLYASSLFFCRTRAELDRHAGRLLLIQVFSVACFLLFPLQVTYTRPAVDGLPGWLFRSLAHFDRAYNAAPSLHVSLAVILWVCYREHWSGWRRRLLAGWFLLIALSAWTTYQHQFIDLPMGLWAGLLVSAAVPERLFAESRRVTLAALYLAAAVALTVAAFWWRGVAWIALWPAFALSMVACAYWTGDAVWLAKQQNGCIAFWMWPYTLGAWLNARWWTRRQTPWHEVADGVWIGRAPVLTSIAPFRTVIDLTAELPVRAQCHVRVLDLTVPRAEQVALALEAIQKADRPVLVCCALGYSRSATVVAAWLVATGRAASAEKAVAQVRRARPQVVVGKEALRRVQSCARQAATAGRV